MTEPDDLLACASCLCLASRQAARALSRSYDKKLRAHGIRVGQFSTLTMLLLKGPMSVGALANSLGVERTTLTRNLALVEGNGWVEIHAGKDARSRIVEATAGGRSKVEAVLPAWREAQAAAAATIGTVGVASLHRLADKPLG